MTSLAASHLFIHIPKNGGTSMKAVLGGHDQRFDFHAPIRSIAARVDIGTHFKFAFVRNPWDRMWSFYHHWARRDPEVLGVEFNDWLISHDDTEERRVDQTAPGDPSVATTRRSQLSWISDIDGTLMVDFVGRFERINEDFEYVCQRLHVSGALPHIRRRADERHYRQVYDARGRDHVAKHFAPDIERFGYSF